MAWISRAAIIFTTLTLVASALVGCGTDKATQTVFTEKEQVNAVKGLIDRVTSGRSADFIVRLLPERQQRARAAVQNQNRERRKHEAHHRQKGR